MLEYEEMTSTVTKIQLEDIYRKNSRIVGRKELMSLEHNGRVRIKGWKWISMKTEMRLVAYSIR